MIVSGEAVSIDTTDDGRDHREISASIHRYKESIALLGRTVQELSQVMRTQSLQQNKTQCFRLRLY